MKRNNPLLGEWTRALATVSILSILSFSLVQCTKKDQEEIDSPCYTKKKFDLYILGSELLSPAPDADFHNYTETIGGVEYRVFQYSKNVSNVCALEHVQTNFRVAVLDEKSIDSISVRARVDWYILFEKKIPLTRTGVEFKGNGEVGLKQVYEDRPGEFTPVVEVYLPTQGSLEKELAVLRRHLISVEIQADYWDPEQ